MIPAAKLGSRRQLITLAPGLLLLVFTGCQTLKPTPEQQLGTFEPNKTQTELDQPSIVDPLGRLANLVLPFFD